ncbi:MAG: serine/threonine-protein kinase, partial [Candidatus Cloacimonetes bacterium]|nr:serine/threonine-protein kinase [Candidatus Cloacimonadota bacterium]
MIIDSRYQVIKELGRGVWGTAYQVLDNRTDHTYALKLFEQLDSQTLYEKFSAEDMHIISQLVHPNLSQVISFGNLEKHIYYIREFSQAQPLNTFVYKNNRVEILYDIIVQCLYALDALHSRKLYHENIKPSNILYSFNISNQIEVKLIDYCFNKIHSDKNQQIVSSSLPYIAPELFSNQTYTVQSDFYALGVTLYQLTTGVLPFSLEQIVSHYTGEQNTFIPRFLREINPDIPNGIEKFIMKMIERNPSDRFEDARSAIAFINKIQSKPYPFSPKFSLVQSIRYNAYIVRENYAHQLMDYVNDLEKGNGKLISITGGKGIGKDALLTLFKYHLFNDKYYVFDYTCSAKNRDPFFALIKEFKTAVYDNEGEYATLEKISPRLKQFMEEAPPVKSKGGLTKKNLETDIDIAKNFLDKLSSEKPLIFIIREAEHITKESLEFINVFSATLFKKPILIIISSSNPQNISGIRYTIQIRIAPLTTNEIYNYIKNMLNVDIDMNFVKNIHQRSAGNPYFLREILVDMIEKKYILHDEEFQFDIDFGIYTLPNHLQELIYSQI